MKVSRLLQFTDKGIYCAAGDFYIDPWRGVDRAVITHAHSDHARPGSKHYLAHRHSAPMMQLRLGKDINLQTVEYGEALYINGVKISLHPAGHMIGSAQVRVEHGGQVWVASGDYKTEDDGVSGAFEPVRCNVFITESTFGLPIYRWKPQASVFSDINNWWASNKEQGKTSMLLCYSVGKAQRVLEHLDKNIGNIYAHAAIYNSQQVLIHAGMPLYDVPHWNNAMPKEKGAMIVAPPSADNSPWMKRFEPLVTGMCSGWMQVRGAQRRRNADAGFALSDHADWPGLLGAIKATGASKVFVTHGYQSVFSRYLNETGIEAQEVVTQYGDDEAEDSTMVQMPEPDETAHSPVPEDDTEV
jgi:putative mRNA 3-end processing factor